MELTPTMWEELGIMAIKSRWSRIPGKGSARSTKFRLPDRPRSSAALEKRGMLEMHEFSIRVQTDSSHPQWPRQIYQRVAHYLPTDAGWEALVGHRGWRTFDPLEDKSGYELTAPDGSVIGTATRGEKNTWCLSWAGEPRSERDTAKRLSDALSRLLGR